MYARVDVQLGSQFKLVVVCLQARDTEVNLQDRKNMPLREFLCVEANKRAIAARFRKFLLEYTGTALG